MLACLIEPAQLAIRELDVQNNNQSLVWQAQSSYLVRAVACAAEVLVF